jgi:hypothetical protein
VKSPFRKLTCISGLPWISGTQARFSSKILNAGANRNHPQLNRQVPKPYLRLDLACFGSGDTASIRIELLPQANRTLQ